MATILFMFAKVHQTTHTRPAFDAGDSCGNSALADEVGLARSTEARLEYDWRRGLFQLSNLPRRPGAAMKRVFLISAMFVAGLFLGGIIGRTLLSRTNRDASSGPPGDTVTVTISATIDGSDRFVFTRDSVWNEHGKWQRPQEVWFNEAPWEDLSQPPPGWLELAATLDLRRARIQKRTGRDLIVLETTADGFDLYFADTPMGAGKYSVTIAIPKQ